MRYQIELSMETKKRAKELANLLLEAGYSVYYMIDTDNKSVAFTLDDSEVIKINYVKVEVDKDAK